MDGKQGLQAILALCIAVLALFTVYVVGVATYENATDPVEIDRYYDVSTEVVNGSDSGAPEFSEQELQLVKDADGIGSDQIVYVDSKQNVETGVYTRSIDGVTVLVEMEYGTNVDASHEFLELLLIILGLVYTVGVSITSVLIAAMHVDMEWVN
jgi:hypothetical protein